MTNPRVLVVDDEPGVAGLVAQALAIRGFEVRTVCSPTEALELVKDEPRYDLLLADVIMPGMCGPELAKRVAELCPTIAIVMMSAFIDCEELPRAAGFISKPFLLTDLYSVVEKTLTRGSAPAAA
jgi:two-component system cell cycle sensor histidine kinase/response regulator CckA